MKRSKWKIQNFSTKIERSRIITPDMVYKTVHVSNGNQLKKLKIRLDHVNHRIGEFIHTKVTPRYKKKANK